MLLAPPLAGLLRMHLISDWPVSSACNLLLVHHPGCLLPVLVGYWYIAQAASSYARRHMTAAAAGVAGSVMMPSKS